MGLPVPCCLCNVLMRVVEGKELTSFAVSLVHPEHDEGLWLNVSGVLATRFVLFNQAVAIRRTVFERIGGFDTSLKYLEDYDLPLRLSLEGPWAFIQEPLVIYGEGSPESFSQRALKDPVVLKECELTIIGRILERVNEESRYANLRRLLKQRRNVFNRGMREVRVRQMNVWGAQWVGRSLGVIGRYQDSLIRRLPGFPKAITVPTDAAKLSQWDAECQTAAR